MNGPFNGAPAAPGVELNGQAEQLGFVGLEPEQLMHLVSASFTERFMGGTRIRGQRGGFAWRNKATGVAELQPFDVTQHDAQMLAILRSFCNHPQNRFVWTVDEYPPVVTCRIGRAVGEQGEAAELSSASTPMFGLSIAIGMLNAVGFDFKAARAELLDEAPRIHLDG